MKKGILHNFIKVLKSHLLLIKIMFASIFICSCESDYQQKIEQSSNFVKIYGGSKFQQGNDIQVTSDGGFIILGSSNSFSANNYDFYLIKTDSKGNEEWSRNYGEEKNDYGNSLIITRDGNYLMAGTTTNQAGFFDILLIKADKNGNELWRKSIGELNFHESGIKVKEDMDGNGYVVVGYTNRLDNGKYSSSTNVPETDISDVIIYKTDILGEVTQSRVLGFNGADYGNDILPIKNANGAEEYVILGTSTRYAESGITNGSEMQFFKSNKSLGTNSELPLGKNATGLAITELSNGGYGLIGSTSYSTTGPKDIFFVKLALGQDNEVASLQEFTYGGLGDEQGKSLIEQKDGCHIILGSTTSFGSGDPDLYLIKVDAGGNQLWARNFGDDGNESAGKVIETPDGGLALLGTLHFGNNEMVYLVKTNSEGLLYNE